MIIIYITNVFISKCSKCKCEINKFNLSLTHWFDCDRKENIDNNIFIPPKNIYINEIYKQLNFMNQKIKVKLNHYKKIKKKISVFISKTKRIIKDIIHHYFKSKLNSFNLSHKKYIDYDDKRILFFSMKKAMNNYSIQ